MCWDNKLKQNGNNNICKRTKKMEINIETNLKTITK